MEDENLEPGAVAPPTAQTTEQSPEKPAESAEGEAKPEGEGDDGEATAEGETSKPEMPKIEFNFDDEPKKKKKSKKSKKDKKALKSFSREYYESLIPQLNGQLAELRKIFTRKDDVNVKLSKELAAIQVDRVDVCEHLERTHAKREKQIVELETTFENLKQEYEEYKVTSGQRIEELQKLYASVEKQLKGEIELQERALSSLDEYRVKRDAALKRYQTTHDHVEDMERQCKEDLFNLEQKNTVQKNVLKKEVKMRLKQVANDFLHSSEIRNAGYTRNLIRENIMLHKTLERRVKQNISIMEQREKQFMKTKEAMESYSSLEQFTEHLSRTINNKEDIIKSLTGRIERMKTKFIDARRYRNLCDKAMEKELFKPKETHNFNDMIAHLERLKADKQDLQWKSYQQEPEIERLRDTLDKLMNAVAVSVSALNTAASADETFPAANYEPGAKEMFAELRKKLICVLIPIVSGTSPDDEEAPEISHADVVQIYRPGLLGFVPAPAQNVCDEEVLTQFTRDKPKVGKFAASNETTSVNGMEFGSYCYYSHTPSVHSTSSGLLSTIDEKCALETEFEEFFNSKQASSSIAGKYRRKRCSCPKKKDSSELAEISVDKMLLKSSLQFKLPNYAMPKRESSSSKCFQHQESKCCGLDCYPYCSDSSFSLQGDKLLKNAKPSSSAVTFGSFLSTYRAEKLTPLKAPCKCD